MNDDDLRSFVGGKSHIASHGMFYLDFLAAVHRTFDPNTYLEIGVAGGNTLALASCPAVAVDPSYAITAEIDGQVSLFRTSSDEYFARPDPLAPTSGTPFDLSFIDGLHLFEYAFRDFINAERYSTPHSVVVLDDVLPRNADEAARERHTRVWTGDVFRVLEVLAEYRPELFAVPVTTFPTGLLIVCGLDPNSTVLIDAYDEIIARFRSPDPQIVPNSILDSTTLFPPERFLASGLLEALRDIAPDCGPQEVRAALRPRVHAFIGAGFGGDSTSNGSPFVGSG